MEQTDHLYRASRPEDGVFEGLFGRGRLASAFFGLEDIDASTSYHPELTGAEHRFLAGLRFEKRRRDWIGGRLAAKRAVVRLAGLRALDWQPQSTRDIEVLPGPTREPIVYSSCANRQRPARSAKNASRCGSVETGAAQSGLQVSISHSGQLAGAVACSSKETRIGFDFERTEGIEPAVYSLAFRDLEIEAIESAPAAWRIVAALALWTAKEAVSKAIGKGLSVSLHDIQLVPPNDFFRSGAGSERFAAFVRSDQGAGGSGWIVDTCQIGGYVLSLASINEKESIR